MSNKPRLKRDWIGRHARILCDMETKGGTVFQAGEVLEVVNNHGGLTLKAMRTCPRCEARHRRRLISKVSEDDVHLLPLDFVPDEPPILPDAWVAVCANLVTWLESSCGPLERAWENTDIGHWDNVEWTYEETIGAIRDGYEDVSAYGEPECVVLYRRLLALLAGVDLEVGEIENGE